MEKRFAIKDLVTGKYYMDYSKRTDREVWTSLVTDAELYVKKSKAKETISVLFISEGFYEITTIYICA